MIKNLFIIISIFNLVSSNASEILKSIDENSDQIELVQKNLDQKDQMQQNEKQLLVKSESIFLNLNGYIDIQGAGTRQSSIYSKALLPNSDSNLGSINRQNNSGNLQSRVHSNLNINTGVELNDIKFGGGIALNPVVGQNENDAGNYANQNFIFIQTDHGKFQAGAFKTASASMRIDATDIARGTGGIGGDWWRFVALSTFDTTGLSTNVANELVSGYGPIFLFQPMLPSEAGFTTGVSSLFVYSGSQKSPDLINGKYNALYPNHQQPRLGWGSMSNKVAYSTTRVKGFKGEISYSPDTGNYGGITPHSSSYAKDADGNSIKMGGATSRASGDVKNLISAGVNYKNQIENLSIALSLTAEHGKSENIIIPYGVNGRCEDNEGCINGYNGRRGLKAFAIGGKILHSGFSFGGSYGSWGKSLQPIQNITKNPDGTYQFPYLVPFNADGSVNYDFEKSYFYNLGAGYGFGPINFSATYIYTNYGGNLVKATSFGTDFKIGKNRFSGLVPYIEYTTFSLQGKTIFLQSTNSSYTPVSNTGNVFKFGVRIIF